MTALGITVVTLAFPDPNVSNGFSEDFQQVSTNLSFSFAEGNKIRTLSTTDSTPGSDISGLLYNPTPSPPSACNVSSQYVPANATKVILPHTGYSFIALAPWISPDCTQAYLKAVQSDPIRAFVFYLLDNSSDIPPLANSDVWGLGDGGRWKTDNKFPVYAIPSSSGNQIMSELANYSGNLTSVPNGHLLASQYQPSWYVRLAMDIDIAGGNNLPSLWVFLLIVLAILIVIIGSTSYMMHWIQRRRRDRLRRRVANGEVDLEALGIKRLTVPQDVLDKMPVYTYASNPAVSAAGTSLTERKGDDNHSDTTSPSRSFSQPTCAICLDDFVNHESQVRELPCGHIFHPECIDSFLKENSSLCPMCKKTVLPRGYCPALVTNAMVRRERMIRRIRERVHESPAIAPNLPPQGFTSVPRLRGAFSRAAAGSRRVFSSPTRSPAGVEMTATEPTGGDSTASRPATAHATSAAPPPSGEPCEPPSPTITAPARSETHSRREWARQRAILMLGNRWRAEDEAIEAEERRIPRWRKFLGRVWPGVA